MCTCVCVLKAVCEHMFCGVTIMYMHITHTRMPSSSSPRPVVVTASWQQSVLPVWSSLLESTCQYTLSILYSLYLSPGNMPLRSCLFISFIMFIKFSLPPSCCIIRGSIQPCTIQYKDTAVEHTARAAHNDTRVSTAAERSGRGV